MSILKVTEEQVVYTFILYKDLSVDQFSYFNTTLLFI